MLELLLYFLNCNNKQIIVGISSSQILPVSITLAICFLACWHVKEAINPLDITKAALDAQLPYLEFANDSRELLEPFTTVLARNLVIPSGG